MKRKNVTRNALVTSILSLLLCVSMLVGTTFAWFTDSVVSGNNVIAAGNLDIELYNDGKQVTSQTNLFDGVKWEPGVVDYENFTIKNEGNLALLYDFAMNWGDYNTLAGQYNLTQVLKVAMVDKHVSGSREAAIAAGEAAGWKALDSWSFSGEMTTKGETKEFALIIYWEPSDNDNNWNVQNGKTLDKGDHLYVNLGINLQATQKMHESDSFGPDYDSLASAWDGSAGEVPAEEDGVITITTGAELAAFAAKVNNGETYKGKTVQLGADINLGNVAWTAIGDCESGKYFQGTFDGQGHTIYNLNVDYSNDGAEHATAGLFGWVDAAGATIKNVNVDGATVKGTHWTGVIAGYFTGTIENCSVNNATVIAYNLNDEANGDKVGGIVGYLNEQSYINGNKVTNTTITGNRDMGGIAGSVAASTKEMKNNKVENVTINYATDKDYGSAGAIVSGRTGYVPNDTNTATNVTFVKAVTVTTAEELKAALSSTAKNISIVLANDIAVDIGTGWNMGGAETESITIKGATSETVLTLSSTYRSYFNLENPEGTLYLQGLKLTNKHAGTHFFDFTTHFNCDVVATDVDFQKAPLVNAVTAEFNDCTFAEPVASYSLWIMAGSDVTVDGAAFNATRGIKIADEDTTDALSTLTVKNATFNTTQKAAIVVASDEGANITLNNVDISKTIDPAHEVWVDEDYQASDAKVTVTGGEKIYEGKVVSNADELAQAVKDGKTDLYLLDGEYNVANCGGKTLTLSGSKKAVLKLHNEGEYGMDYGFDGATVTFNGVTIDTTANGGTYPGYARMAATFNNCTINGTFNLSSGEKTFNNCEFNVSGDAYNVWTWGVKKVTFIGCTFNCDGKSVLVYNQTCDVTVTNCVFNDNGDNTITGKSALETGVDGVGTATYKITITDTEFNGFAENDKNVGYQNIVGNKNSISQDYLNIVVDGNDVY